MSAVAETVERLAKAAGMLHPGPGVGPEEAARVGWHVVHRPDGRWHIWQRTEAGPGASATVDDPTALLAVMCLTRTETLASPAMESEAEARAWARARVLSGSYEILRPSGQGPARLSASEFVARVTRPVAVKVGRCPACEARSWPGARKLATSEWTQRNFGSDERWSNGDMVVSGKDLDEHRRPDLQAGWTATWLWTDGRRHRCVASRPCPDCHGTGEQWAEVGRLVLDAARADVEWRYAMTPGERDRLVGAGWSAGKWTWVGEVKIWPMSRRCEARPPLHVQATRWQDLGDPLGEWLALFLAGRDEWEQEASARA